MTMTRDDTSMIRSMTSRCTAVGSARTVCSVVTIGMVSRDEQRQDVAARLAAENAELVLQSRRLRTDRH